MTTSLYAEQHVRRMRGGSQAHLIRASDNNFYIVKFQNNPQHIRVLVSEFLGSRLGVLLGLPMPEVRVIDVSEWLITNTPELRIESVGLPLPCAAGLQVASRYACDIWQDQVFDYMPESMFRRLKNPEDFPRVLAFDKWVGNCDGRQAVFVKSHEDRLYRAVFIDQGHCFNCGEWTFPDLDLHGVYHRNHVYQNVTGWDSFEPTLSRLEQLNISELWTIASEIPKDWHQYDCGGLARLIETLHSRRSSVRSLISAFGRDSRNPFPNWILEK